MTRPRGRSTASSVGVAMLAALAVLAVPGCLVASDDAPAAGNACNLLGGPHQVAASAGDVGGPGSRIVRLTEVPRGDAIAAWWTDADGVMQVLHLRSDVWTEPGSAVVVNPATARVPTDVDVRFVAGRAEWTREAYLGAGRDEALLDLGTVLIKGATAGTWDQPATFGPAGAAWQPTTLPWADERTMALLDVLELELTWTNGLAGGADFGIAVGPSPSGGFQYVNGAYQAVPGEHTEILELDAAELAALGWSNATRPQAGPSVSTGAFATTGIAYDLAWTALLRPDPDLPDVCRTLGDADARLVDA